MEKYHKKIDIAVRIPSTTLTYVPLDCYDIEEWIGKCNDIEVLGYLSRSIIKHIGVLRQDDNDYDITR